MDGSVSEFEPITNPVMIVPGRRQRIKLTLIGQSKNRPHSGGAGRAGRRKEQGWRKGRGLAGGPTPPRILAGRQKEEKQK